MEYRHVLMLGKIPQVEAIFINNPDYIYNPIATNGRGGIALGDMVSAVAIVVDKAISEQIGEQPVTTGRFCIGEREMKEIQEIVHAFEEARQQHKQTALATVVHVAGSSYRRPGARMLVTEDGELTGAISGGCLEGDALRKARLAMAQQKNMLVTYDTTDDEDNTFGVGLGCNGVIQILIEPIQPDNPQHPVALLKQVLSRRQEAVLVTLFSLEHRYAPQPGTCLLLTGSQKIFCPTLEEGVAAVVLADAQEVLEAKLSQIKNYTAADATFTAFIEHLKPTVSLVICGAGNDVQPLVQMANILGWQTTVVDGRTNYATTARFPTASRVVVAKPAQVLQQVEVDAQTVFLLMTHNYLYDLGMLRQLLPLAVPYVGVLGPKKKTEALLADLEEEGMVLNEAQLQRLFGPVGLDIGAETAEEISLSIMAEIKAVFARKAGASLREKQEPIHERTATAALESSSKAMPANFQCQL